MPEVTPISAAALGTVVVAAQPVGQFASNTPEPLPLPDLPEPVATTAPVEQPPRHPGVTAILRHFEFNHLPEELQKVSREFHILAHLMASMIKDDPELVAGLRKLLEAKDCMVRAAITGR